MFDPNSFPLNGSTATGTTQVYTSPVTPPRCADTTYKAIAYKSGFSDSSMTSYVSQHSGDAKIGVVLKHSIFIEQGSHLTI